MTNEELDRARAEEAQHLWVEAKYDAGGAALIAARLAREGWTPPVEVDPDLAEAKKVVNEFAESYDWTPESLAIRAIKRGRALAAEAKPGLVWVKHDGSTICPVDRDIWVLTKTFGYNPCVNRGKRLAWQSVSFYCVITPPEDVA